MGLRLLTRTTRSVAPTDVGERLLRALAPRIGDIEADIDALMEVRDKPSGSIRTTLSDHALDSVVWPKLRSVLVDYPDIAVELYTDNGFRNIVEDRFDAGVRLGESVDKDMIAVRIGLDWRLVAVATPQYFTSRAIPMHPQELVEHICINQRHLHSGGLYVWEFAKGGRDLRVRVNGQLVFSTSYAQIDAALAGYGLAYLPEDLVAEHIASGRLTHVLDDWSPKFSGYHLYYPSRRQSSPAFQIIVEALRER